MQTKTEVLQACRIEGNIVRLPDTQLDRKLYQEVAKSLNLIGGTWKGHKVMGFVFKEDPTELLEEIAGGGTRNLKKEYQFFATSEKLAARLVQLAGIDNNDLMVMEPSAGQGAIIKAILKKQPGLCVHYFEIMDINRKFLEKIPDAISLGKDFLTERKHFHDFDKIVANPPFSKNQDIDHIYQMYRSLKHGGRLVSMASKHWQISSNKKEHEFRIWLQNVKAQVLEVPAGEFKESGTEIATCIIIINR